MIEGSTPPRNHLAIGGAEGCSIQLVDRLTNSEFMCYYRNLSSPDLGFATGLRSENHLQIQAGEY
jgi:hypothetical protein